MEYFTSSTSLLMFCPVVQSIPESSVTSLALLLLSLVLSVFALCILKLCYINCIFVSDCWVFLTSDSATRSCPTTLWPRGLYSPWDSPGQSAGMGSLSFLQGSSQPRNWTGVSCIAGGFFTSWAIRDALIDPLFWIVQNSRGVFFLYVCCQFTLLVAHSFLRHPFSILVSGIPELFYPLTLYANKTVAFHLISDHKACTVGSSSRGRKTSHQANSNTTRALFLT